MKTRPQKVVALYLALKNADTSWKLPDKIIIKYINHKNQLYNSDGDYYEHGKDWDVYISKMEDWRYSFACTIHELVEMALTKNNKINWKNITDFDIKHPKFLDPGHHKDAPYHTEHMEAEKIEREIIKLFGLDWDTYEKDYAKLDKYPPSKSPA